MIWPNYLRWFHRWQLKQLSSLYVTNIIITISVIVIIHFIDAAILRNGYFHLETYYYYYISKWKPGNFMHVDNHLNLNFFTFRRANSLKIRKLGYIFSSRELIIMVHFKKKKYVYVIVYACVVCKYVCT